MRPGGQAAPGRSWRQYTTRAALCGQPGWRLVFGHYPTRSTAAEGQSASWLVRGALESLIRACAIQVYFAGHDHHQAHLDLGGYQEIIEGAGGRSSPRSRLGTRSNALGGPRMVLPGCG